MPYSVVMRVKLPQITPEEDERMLREMVIPHAKQQPGFASGTWMRNSQNQSEGLGVVVFETEDNARAAAEVLKPPPGGPELVSVDVYEVGAQA